MQIGENAKQISALAAITHASAATFLGAAVDCSGYDEVTYILDVGIMTGAGCTSNVKITESATSGGTYADITGAAFAELTASNDVATYLGRVRVNPLKPFQKVSETTSGTVTTCPISVSAILSKSNGLRKPVATPSFQVTAV